MANGTYSNKDLYDNLDKLRLELKADILGYTTDLRTDIRGLRQDFNTMEAGRLTKAENNINHLQLQVEGQINKLRANQSIANFKIMVIWALVIVAAQTIITSVIVKVITK